MPPITPCSSVNSRTMSVARSAFASLRGARRRVRRRPAARTRPSRATAPAARCARPSARYDPSALWNSTRLEPRAAAPRGRPADPRPRRTARRAAAPSPRARRWSRSRGRCAACVLVTARNAGISAPVAPTHRKEMLMMNQRRRQHFRRQRQELGAERAGDDRRELDEIRHFLEQRLGLRDAGAAWRGRRCWRACASRSRMMRSRRSMRERITKFSVSFLRYSSKLRTLIARPARPLVARKRWP